MLGSESAYFQFPWHGFSTATLDPDFDDDAADLRLIGEEIAHGILGTHPDGWSNIRPVEPLIGNTRGPMEWPSGWQCDHHVRDFRVRPLPPRPPLPRQHDNHVRDWRAWRAYEECREAAREQAALAYAMLVSSAAPGMVVIRNPQGQIVCLRPSAP